MSGFFEGLINRGSIPVLQTTWSFVQARHAVIAENVANMSTPDYKAKRLDMDEFQQVLGEAIEDRRDRPGEGLLLGETDQIRQDRSGNLIVSPEAESGRNLVFHDGTNMSIEQEMADLASNAMWHEITTTLLDGKFDSLRKAIRGQA